MLKDLLLWISNNAKSQLDELKHAAMPLAAVPDGIEIENLEKHMAQRARFRGLYRTASLDAFVSYTAAKHKAETLCFVDTDGGLSATSIFNIGTDQEPGHCDNKAELELPASPEYKAFQTVDGRQMSQRDAAEWLEDWRDQITFLDASGEAIDKKQSLNAMRNIKQRVEASSQHEERNFGSTRSTLESIDVNTGDVEPAYIKFDCIPYSGMQNRTLNARISISTGSAPAVTIRSICLDKEIEEIGDELVAKLTEKLEGITVYQGTFKS